MLKLLITADYEVFGDGSGCVQKCLITPAEKMMRVCEEIGTRITFFVDYCEYRAFCDAEQSGALPKTYRPGTWITEQLEDIVKRGHDVQLHLHPQWIESKFISPLKWDVNLQYWRLHQVPSGYGNKNNPDSILGLFSMGRNTFEKLLRPVKSEYTCRAFRAGAWCIQPETQILPAMNETEFWYDTSAIPGVKRYNELTKFDYTAISDDLPAWMVSDCLAEVDAEGAIAEIPVFTLKINVLYRALFSALKYIKPFHKIAPDCIYNPKPNPDKQSVNINRSAFLKTLKAQYEVFDFCRSSSMKMKFFIKNAFKKYSKSDSLDKCTPLVMVGHPKGFGNENEFRNFLYWAKDQEFIETDSLSECSFWWQPPEKHRRNYSIHPMG